MVTGVIRVPRFGHVLRRVGPHGLQHQFGQRLLDFRAFDLEYRCLRSRPPALAFRRHHTQVGDLQRHQVHFHAGNLFPETRIIDEALAIHLLATGDFLQVGQFTLGAADTGDARALVAEQILGVGPAFSFLADEIGDRYLDVLEPHLVHLMLAVQHDDGPDRHAGCGHVDEQEGDAFLLFSLAAGAHEAKNHVGVLRQRGPCLLAVDDIVVALPLRLCFERCEIGTGAGLRIALAPPVVAGVDARQVVVLLRLVAEFHDDRCHHGEAEGDQRGRAGGGILFVEDVPLHGRPAGAAPFHGPAGRDPVFLVEDFLPSHVVLAVNALVVEHLVTDVLGQGGAHELAHLFAKGGLFGGVIQIHRDSSPRIGCCAYRCGMGRAVFSRAVFSNDACGLA